MDSLKDRKLVILYGSQTGTAQEVAERIGRDARRYRFNVLLQAMDDYCISNLVNEDLIVFVCSTTGQGEAPDNMKTFWKFLLRKNLPANSLQGVKFSVVGLGDSFYLKFNFVAKRLNRRLLQLGGECFCTIALTDDQHDLGLEGVLNPWLESFWNMITSEYPLPIGIDIISKDVLPKPKYNVVLSNDDDLSNGFHEIPNFHMAKMKSCDRVTDSSHFQDVRLIKLDISGSGMHYKPGDVAVIQPSNLEKNVQDFFRLFPKWNPQQKILVSQIDPNIPVPSYLQQELTLHECVSKYLDIQSIPKRYFFEVLQHFTSSNLEKEKFEEFCSSAGQEELFAYCNRQRRTIIEALDDFPHTTPNIPLSYLFDIIPFIQTRSFSIASSEQSNEDEIHLLVGVVKYKTRLKEPRRGLCSNWLASLRPGDVVPLRVRSTNSFIFPESSVPIIMVGPGTGVAPFRSLIQQRVHNNLGQNCLFFGCRNESMDYFCADEWRKYVDKGLLKVITAFSRDQDEKIYVQHRLLENSSLVWQLINNDGAYFYIAGNSKRMPGDVRDALKSVIMQEGQLDDDEADSYVNNLQTQKRFQMETWS